MYKISYVTFIYWMGAAKFVGGPQIVELRVTLGQTASMPSPDAAARHTGAGVARRQAHHERMRDERAREAAAGDAEVRRRTTRSR